MPNHVLSHKLPIHTPAPLPIWPDPPRAYAAGGTNLFATSLATWNITQGSILVASGGSGATARWVMSGGAIYSAESRTADGSGSLDLSANTASATVNVANMPDITAGGAGDVITIRFYMKATATTPANGKGGIVVCNQPLYTSASAFIRNAVGQRFSVKTPGEWEECVMHCRLDSIANGDVSDAGKCKITFSKQGTYAPAGLSILIDEVSIFAGGPHFTDLPTPKVAVDGRNVRVDSMGNWYIKRSGVWIDYFPFAIYQDTAKASYQVYADQGFNTVMFGLLSTGLASTLVSAKAAVNVEFCPYGMYGFLEIADYCISGYAHYGDLAGLATNQAAILASTATTNLLGYYFDNESYEYATPTAVMAQLTATDPSRPIYMNSGDGTIGRDFTGDSLPLVVGSYMNDVDHKTTLGTSAQIPQYEGSLMSFPPGIALYGMGSDVQVTETQLRRDLWRGLIQGARGFSLYRDGSINGDITTHSAWSAIPQIRRDIETLMPAIRASRFPAFTVASSVLAIVVGPRQSARGDYYIFIVNEQNQSHTSTLTVSGITIANGTTAYDALAGTAVTTFTANAISVTLAAYATLTVRFTV